MKHILLLLMCLFITCGPVFAVNTNTSLSMSNIVNEIDDTKFIIGEWRAEITKVKQQGFGISILFSFIMLSLTSLIIMGVILVMLLNVIQFFTKPAVDIKIQKVEDWITDYIIKLPIKILAFLRGTVKKKP